MTYTGTSGRNPPWICPNGWNNIACLSWDVLAPEQIACYRPIGDQSTTSQATRELLFSPRYWQPDTDYRQWLINWKEANHTHGRTQNNTWLMALKPDNPLMIHPETAERLNIAEGDEVWVESPYGKTKGKVHLTRRMHPEVVGAQHGFGHTALGNRAKGRGSAFGSLNMTKSDPLSGMAAHKEVCVKVYKA